MPSFIPEFSAGEIGIDGVVSLDLSGYVARQQPDGTWNIDDVPFMGELEEETKGNPFPIDETWLKGAVRKATFRLLEQSYRAPLHILHHDFNSSTQRAGFIMPTSVRPMMYEGKIMATLFGSLQGVPDHVLSMIKRDELPYRSVEVNRWESGEVSTLALLDDEPPFFKFPPLKIRESIPYEGLEELQNVGDYVVSLKDSGRGGPLVMCFEGEKKMPEETTNPQVPDPNAPAAPAPNGTDELIKQMVTQQGAIMEILGAIKEGMGLNAAQEEDPKKDPGEEKPDAKAAEAVVAEPPAQGPGSTPVEVTKLKTEVKVLREAEALRAAREKKTVKLAEAHKQADEAIQGIRDKGRHISDSMKTYLRQASEVGPEHLTGAIGVINEIPIDPPNTLDGVSGGPGSPYPAEVLKFRERSEKHFAAACGMLPHWNDLVKHGRSSGTLADWLETNVTAEVDGFAACME